MSKLGEYAKQESGSTKIQNEQSKAPELSKVAAVSPGSVITQTRPIEDASPYQAKEPQR